MDDDDNVIVIVGLIQGGATSFDGQYLVEYDPARDGVDPGSGMPMLAHIVTTPDLAEAARFSAIEAFELWRRVDPRHPVRTDGSPNRPLTAFTVDIRPAGS